VTSAVGDGESENSTVCVVVTVLVAGLVDPADRGFWATRTLFAFFKRQVLDFDVRLVDAPITRNKSMKACQHSFIELNRDNVCQEKDESGVRTRKTPGSFANKGVTT